MIEKDGVTQQFEYRYLELLPRFDDFMFTLAGQERFRSLSVAFYRGADCCVLVYDTTVPCSFKYLEICRDEFLNQVCPDDPDHFPFVVLGNKSDLENQAVNIIFIFKCFILLSFNFYVLKITQKMAQDWCRSKNDIPYFQTSAKNGNNVDIAFDTVAKNAITRQGLVDDVDDVLEFPLILKIDNKKRSPKKFSC